MFGTPACSPNNDLRAINGTAATVEAEAAATQGIKKGGKVNA